MYRDPEAKKAVAEVHDEDVQEGEDAQEDAAVANNMKTFEGGDAGEDEDDEGEEEGEAWGQTNTGGADYAK